MQRRPTSILGMTAQIVRTRWARLGRNAKIAVVAVLVVGGLALASSAQCLLASSSACPASGGCPPCAGYR